MSIFEEFSVICLEPENGEYPDDMKRLGKIVKDISYNNAVRYFGFDLQIQE